MRKALALWFLLLFSLSAGTLIIAVVANPSSYVKLFDNIVITVQSPQSKTYAETTIPLNFTVETNNEEQGNTRYILNNQEPIDVETPVISSRTETGRYGDGYSNNTFTYPRYTARGSAVLNDLSDGVYNLTIQRYFADYMKPDSVRIVNSTTVIFSVSAQLFSMPEEQVNYNITQIGDSLWAKIDGIYPITYSGTETSIPMVYPTPPRTTNISVWMNNDELNWSRFTETNPEALHHTAIGEWSEILTVLDNVSDYFVLRIHYEHPLQIINGSYMFLYDLNIQEYLSAACNSSVAHFTVTMDMKYADFKVNSVDPATEVLKPIEYVTLSDGGAMIKIDEVSEFGKTLPGDLLVSFSTAETSVSIAAVSVSVVAAVVAVAAVVYVKKRSVPKVEHAVP